jgi:AraC-like DNA-binding protein
MNCKCQEFKNIVVDEKEKQHEHIVNKVGCLTIASKTVYPQAEESENNLSKIVESLSLTEYQIVYITKGSGVLKLESSEYIQVYKGQVIFFFPGQQLNFSASGNEEWKGYFIRFEEQIIGNIIDKSFLSKEKQVLDVGLNVELVNLFIRAMEVIRTDKAAPQQHLLGIMIHIIGLILYESQTRKKDNSKDKQIVEMAKIIMTENISNRISSEELASQLGVNYVTFRSLFKRQTGFAPAQYNMNLKITKAKQLLMESELSVKEIFGKFRYYSPQSLSLSFKKSTGETPTKYRFNCK